ncbi:MAG: DUF1580 domain-containing protein [Planctomycetaceae bacterium]
MLKLRSSELLSGDTQDLKPLGYARKWWIPRDDNNKPVSPATLYRWIRKGVKGVKLDAVFTPSGCVTSEAACRQFLAEVDSARRNEMSSAGALDATDEQLRAVGLRPGA